MDRAPPSAGVAGEGAEPRDSAVPWDDTDGVDLSLLRGFRFTCRPGCGLCCFATPAVNEPERRRLIQLRPGLALVRDGDWTGIALQGDGGACALLEDRRCALHAARPSPCRLFPLHVHFGHRAQATVALHCPGVGVPAAWLEDPEAAPDVGPEGLAAERAWLHERLPTAEVRRSRARAARDHARAVLASGPEADLDHERATRQRLSAAPPEPTDREFPLAVGPSEEDGLETLPIFHDERFGTLAIADADEELELLRLDPRGGVAERVGRFPRPLRPPRLDAPARRLLRSYLGLIAARDVWADGIRHAWLVDGRPGALAEAWATGLRADGALVLERAMLRARLRGRTGERLDLEELLEGIRAVDAELLDRPAIGAHL